MPLHCHPTKQAQSVFHVISHKEFDSLPDKAVQDIFRRQHIVVYDQPHKELRFGEALRTLGGGLDRKIELQGLHLFPPISISCDLTREVDQSMPLDEDRNQIIRVGTLHDLLKHAASPTGNALNALDFPMHQASMTPTSYSSDAHALLQTVQNPKLDSIERFPVGDFRWGLAATSGAFHPFHIDSNGLATYVTPLTGTKWWIVARPINNTDFSVFEDINLLLGKTFDINGNGSGLFCLEAILLKPGTTL